MQQTEKYKLNLIESSDPFLPEALNQNTRKVEAAMLEHEAAVQAENSALEARIVKFACGVITFNQSNNYQADISLPFTPKAVLGVCDPGGTFRSTILAVGEGVFSDGQVSKLQIQPNGFHVNGNSKCTYIAFG